MICSTFGGIGTMTRTLARGFTDRGHGITVYVHGVGNEIIDDDGVRIRVLEKKRIPRSILTMRKQIRSDLRDGLIDIVESAECDAHCLPMNKHTVVRLHGSHHFWCRTLSQKRKLGRLLLEQTGIRQASALCSVSRFTADVTREVMGLGRRDIEIIHNPVDTDLFVPRQDCQIRGRIVFVGSIVEKKGIRELCQSMRPILKEFPDAELHVAGADRKGFSGRSSFQGGILECIDLDTAKQIHFLGHLTQEKVRDLMCTAEVCVFPSYMETQGIAICEAMACGRPVVAGKSGPGPEIIGDNGECGFLVDPADPANIAERVCHVLGNAEGAAIMGRNGRQRAEKLFSTTVCLDKNLRFYEGCLNGVQKRR